MVVVALADPYVRLVVCVSLPLSSLFTTTTVASIVSVRLVKPVDRCSYRYEGLGVAEGSRVIVQKRGSFPIQEGPRWY